MASDVSTSIRKCIQAHDITLIKPLFLHYWRIGKLLKKDQNLLTHVEQHMATDVLAILITVAVVYSSGQTPGLHTPIPESIWE